nr:putative reverse transcriptase domain-containing protein [Tanacetum cinerariifolium]
MPTLVDQKPKFLIKIPLRRNGDYKGPQVFDDDQYEEEIASGDVGVNLMVRRSCLTPIVVGDDWLRHNIFLSTCTILGKVCTIVVDPKSCDNLIAEEAVQKLGLKTDNHPKPYKLQWLMKSGEDELEMGDEAFVLVGKEVAEGNEIPEAMIPLPEDFSNELPDRLPPLCDVQHHIDLEPCVEELVSKGHLCESMSPCVVPSLLTPKKDGTCRMCVDSQAINKITMRYMFPIPRLDDLLDQISGATIFMTLDLKGGYYQIRLRPGDKWKTAFKMCEGLYEWLMMPFGLSNAPRTCMCVMNQLLRPLIRKFMVVHLNDILIYSASFCEHVTHVRQDLALLCKGSFHAAMKKCVFMTPKAFFWTIKHWRHYLFHKEFVLFTDHNSLRHIRTQDTVSHKHGRWLAFLEKFTFVVKHKTGVSSRAVDALSRRTNLLVSMYIDVLGLDVIPEQLTLDPYFSIVLQGVQSGIRLKVIKELHGEGHVGRDRTLQLPWVDISIGFVLGLPCTKSGNDSIFVVLDRVSKMVHFIPCKKTTYAVNMGQIFFRDAYYLHGLPSFIVYDQDTQLLSHFWCSLWKMVNPQLNFSSAYHPQTNGQTKVVNRSFGNLLRCLVGDHVKAWDQKLCRAEFAHNHDVNRSTRFSPFQVVYSTQQRGPLDLMSLLVFGFVPKKVQDFVVGLYAVHKAVCDNLVRANSKYKQYANQK